MAIPIIYNLRSVRARWVSAIVAVLGIAGTVGVFIAMLSLARGFKATLVASGSPDNALIRRAGSTGEIDGTVPLDQVKVIQDAPGIARDGDRPLVSPGGGCDCCISAEGYGDGRECAGARCFAGCAEGSQERAHETRAILPAGIERIDRGEECAVNICGAESRRQGAVRRR